MPDTITIREGSRGTCFSGGSGSGGTYGPTLGTIVGPGGANGGKGSDSIFGPLAPTGESAAGAGNPNGSVELGPDSTYDGTGGVLIVFVEGTITTSSSSTKHFTANGVAGRQTATPSPNYSPTQPFGGGTGGGIIILVNANAASLTNNMEAKGGVVVSAGPSPNFQSGGNGATVAYTFGAL